MNVMDDKERVRLTAKDPETGFRCLMKKYKEAVYWHIRRLVVAHEDAQDATQETFVRVFRSLSVSKASVHCVRGFTGLLPTRPCGCSAVTKTSRFRWMNHLVSGEV